MCFKYQKIYFFIKRSLLACCPELQLEIALGANYKLLNDLLIDKKGRLVSSLSKLPKIIIPDLVKLIGNGAFYRCENLQSVQVPKSVITIGEHAFPEGCEIIRV